MAGVFISYRREDAPGHAGRIFDRVRARFGADVVFMDVTAIDAGVDFVDAIDSAVGTCDVLLAVIGPQWSSAADRTGQRRLDSATDFVRLEIGGALKRNVRVVPVLVDGAQLPTAGDLPEELQPLLRRNAVELRDARWDADIEQLIASLERIVTKSDGPLRLEAPPRGRQRWVAAIAVLALSATAAAVYGPRACASPPPRSVVTTAPTTTAPAPTTATAPAAPRPSAAAPVKPSPSPAAAPPLPDVVGKSLSDARAILRRAGVDVSRVLYRDDRTKAIDEVVARSAVSTTTGTAAVVLTAVARASIVIQHRPEDLGVARRLLGVLTSSRSMDGVVLRTLEMPTLRAESIARVNYSDVALVSTAGAIARDANAWLAQNDPGRPTLTATRHPPVVARTIVIGLPERGSTGPPPPSSAALPDVRGMTLVAARRALSAAGASIGYKWSDDGSRTPLEVFGQSEVSEGSGRRTAVLEVGAKGTLFLYYLAADAPIAERFTRALQSNMNLYGILVRPIRLTAPRPTLVGKVASADAMLSREAQTAATFATKYFATQEGRQLRIEAVSNAGGDSRQIMFGLPSLR